MAHRPAAKNRIAVVAGVVCIAVIAIALTPGTAHAWTPATHIFLGEAILRSLAFLPASIAEVIAAFPYDFLYGSIAADTSVAKKYAAAGRHCHSWKVGLEIHEKAASEPMRAFALGYLSHLAADTVAHNYFVPHQLAITSTTTALGHSYWESRIDTHIGERYSRRAREVILLDHSASDGHLDRILSPTIFSTSTNRRIFRGMVYVTDTESWQRVFQMVSEKSRWDLASNDVGAYMTRSYNYIIDLLNRFDGAEPFALDPTGTRALREAKRVRRAAMRTRDAEVVVNVARASFGMPPSVLVYSSRLSEPIYPPPDRDISS
ncbi:MAG: zinc dependent phospholipase C family protein [Gemmatimonadaceae bacterium]